MKLKIDRFNKYKYLNFSRNNAVSIAIKICVPYLFLYSQILCDIRKEIGRGN